MPLTSGQNTSFLRKSNECLELYKNCTNWLSLAYNADCKNDSLNKACGYPCSTNKDYALIDSRYLDELDQFFKFQLNSRSDQSSRWK